MDIFYFKNNFRIVEVYNISYVDEENFYDLVEVWYVDNNELEWLIIKLEFFVIGVLIVIYLLNNGWFNNYYDIF